MLSRFCLVFLPTTLASLPPGVMLLNRSTTLRDSTTDIEETYRKGASEQKLPNRSVVKKKLILIFPYIFPKFEVLTMNGVYLPRKSKSRFSQQQMPEGQTQSNRK